MREVPETVRVEIGLPGVVLSGGKVAHLLIQPGVFREEGWWAALGQMACHTDDCLYYQSEPPQGWRWATATDPLCRKCLVALKAYVNGEVRDESV